LRFPLHIFDLKAFARLAGCSYKAYFPGLPNCENFLKASNQPFPFAVVPLQYLLELNRRMGKGGLFFFDSTALSVCANGNISARRVTEGFASRGMASKGWFFGFKLRGACDARGNPVNLRFTAGSVRDSRQAERLTGGLNGIFAGDAGPLLRKGAVARLFERHKRILAAARKNMKRLMTEGQGALLRKRNIIETVRGKLKERYGPVFHLARNTAGLFRHYCYSPAGYMLEPFSLSSTLRLPDFAIGLLA
jgi:hypothetical protein